VTEASPSSDSKTPALAAFALVAIGIVIAAIGDLKHGSLVGGVIAGFGAFPAMFGMWKGIQQETQGTLAISVAAVLVSLGIAAVLIVLRVVYWL
jgi:hypothetical protein